MITALLIFATFMIGLVGGAMLYHFFSNKVLHVVSSELERFKAELRTRL